jgi:hypothetical protein
MEKRFLSAVFGIVLCLFLFTGTAAGESFDEPPKALGIMQPSPEQIEQWQHDYDIAPQAAIDEEIQATIAEESSDEPPEGWGIMRPSPEQIEQWQHDYDIAPLAPIDEEIKEMLEEGMPGASGLPKPLLLDYIPYTPVQRNQASCGNCWVWAGTALLEIQHSLWYGVHDRLSIQFFDTNKTTPRFACCGGWLSEFATAYNNSYNSEGSRRMIPWTNTDAHWQDGARNCGSGTLVDPWDITNTPYYSYPSSMTAQTISTLGVSQTTAINNIKNILAQGKGVWWAFFLADFGPFKTFWNTQNETVIWDPDTQCGWNYSTGADPGGHAVTIVGYNDDDASTNNHYWIVLNSWGSPSGRPNGLFRLKMYIDYGCTMVGKGQVQYFQTLGNIPYDLTGRFFNAMKGSSSNSIWVRNRKLPYINYYSWVQIDGATTHAPAMAMFNTSLYMAVKGGSNNNIYVRRYYMGTWNPWETVPGGTNVSPALVVYKHRLYLFVKGASSGVIYYKSLGTSGTWSSTWSTVPGSWTIDTPAVVAYDDKLILFQTGPSNTVYLKRMYDDLSWGGWASFPTASTPSAPSAIAYDGYIRVFIRGMSNSIYYAKMTKDTNGYWGWYNSCGGSTSTSPSVTREPNGYLVLSVKGASSNNIYSKTWSEIEGWPSNWTVEAGMTSDTPVMNSYWPD